MLHSIKLLLLLLLLSIKISLFSLQISKFSVNFLFSFEQLHSIINTPENTRMQLTDYLYYDLLPRVDAHSEVDINGQKTQLAVIINYCRNVYKPRDVKYGLSALATKFNVSKSTMSYILNNKT